MLKQILMGTIALALALNACSYDKIGDSTSAMCQALADGDKILAAGLIDTVAQQQTASDWKINIDQVILWLETQDCVKDAHSDYPVIETLPEQTEIVVKMVDGTTEILDLYIDLNAGTVWVNQFH